MNAGRVRALIVKDWIELSRNRQTLAPVIMLPIVFAVLLPTTMIAATSRPEALARLDFINSYLESLPPAIAADPTRAMVEYFMAPIFLMIPVVVATVLATAAFVGEKERDTLEGLLFTPLTDRELVVGKILVSWVPAVLVTWLSTAIYAVVVAVFARPWQDGWAFPNVTWLALVGIIAPLVSFFAIGCIVLISHRASTLQGAQAVAGLLVLPVIVLIMSQASGAMAFDRGVVVVVGVVAAIGDLIVFHLAVRRFDRDRVVTRL
ncbi:ABC transporter permease subunit [Aeromicrobium sp. 636]|uniref:ABC transporter permease subunit n=1 Tax=Aeromicrobium senzhongii TaxID=2663859 RepID=A0A8I0ERX7_9ACTN|nr:ABC transporter permease subunit [Aeromicrobium sp. 636]MBC9225090.1 ABC transporter permease subunit [Aeromicrobium senzhongii]MCQ3997200.1 ABC transporter permease subunit [Aeromicrobium sp. 636]